MFGCWKMVRKGKKNHVKNYFLQFGDMENIMKKKMRKNIKENIMIFFLLFSLKNNEENKRKRERKSGGKFYRALVSSSRTSPPSPHFPGLLLHHGHLLPLPTSLVCSSILAFSSASDRSSSATLALKQAISFAAAWIWSIQGEVGLAGG